ncbi:MAG TPA: hypothetical protein VFS76_20060 [Pyrinomonadaceae bacterium]|nr:hypothetical protein [Pyrinomonadaceae bacterium]
MPKDATKNVDRYKVRGGQLNEFEFHQNQAATATKSTDKKGSKKATKKPSKKK